MNISRTCCIDRVSMWQSAYCRCRWGQRGESSVSDGWFRTWLYLPPNKLLAHCSPSAGTKNFLRFHQIKQQQSNITDESIEMDDYDGSETMIGRSAEDEGEYASRAEEIEAWLRNYGERYLGVRDDTITGDDAEGGPPGYEFHPTHWKYVILDDRPSAAKRDTPLFDRFVFTNTKLGLTEEDTTKAIQLLLRGPKKESCET